MKFLISLLRLLPPELAHLLALNALHFLYVMGLSKFIFPSPVTGDSFIYRNLNFKNRLGIAAGLDKNGDYIDSLGSLGFGFIEIGTVTPLAQAGNPKPRIFRLFNQHAIINRLGFNNKGLDYLVSKVKSRKYSGILGINIGANKDSEGQKRIDDYIECFYKVSPYADYIAVNISSPNTPNLRALHARENFIHFFLPSTLLDLNKISPTQFLLNYLQMKAKRQFQILSKPLENMGLMELLPLTRPSIIQSYPMKPLIKELVAYQVSLYSRNLMHSLPPFMKMTMICLRLALVEFLALRILIRNWSQALLWFRYIPVLYMKALG